MGCVIHNYGWPRKRGEVDIQTCSVCGAQRESKIRFGIPMRRQQATAAKPSPIRRAMAAEVGRG